MNRASQNTILLILLSSIIVACLNSENSIQVKKEDANNPIILRMSKKLKKVTGIKLPFILTIANTSYSKKEFYRIEYLYNSKEKGSGIGLFDKDSIVSNSERKTISRKTRLSYLIYSRHFIDLTATTQQELKPYVKKMIAENKDTLHIGTVTEFKTKHKALFEKLTKGDSIEMRFFNGKRLREEIIVPVEW